MIRKLTINKVAIFDQEVEIKPTEINYFYGSNGSGKTTLSKVIADVSAFSDCTLDWENEPIKSLVYNRDFVKSHFSQSNTIKGIFTLGKDAVEAKEFIENAKNEIEGHTTALGRLNESLGKNQNEINESNTKIREECWATKDKHIEYFREAYTGFIGSKESFFQKCYGEQTNTSRLLDLEEIKKKCQEVFSKTLQAYDQIQPLQHSDFEVLEKHPILTTKIVGKEDLPIAALITKLDNSDWIKQGLNYLAQVENQCPFCQQSVSTTLQDEIESIFDESYSQKITDLNAYQADYTHSISTIITSLNAITELETPILDFTELRSHISLLEEKYKSNLARIQNKVKFPSNLVELDSLSTDLRKAQNYIESYRAIIENNNATVENIDSEKTILKSEIWRFTVNELLTALDAHKSRLPGLQTGKNSIKIKITETTTNKQSLEKEIKEKEVNMTSTIHTKNEINAILKSFGFTNFSISEAEKGCYKILRQDGSDAKETLSEGEYNFITFLYFYYLTKGSINETGQTTDKVIVIDDPVSSLDSNVIFIVSHLIRKVIADCRDPKIAIKQIFILTHNIYFHKEVTFKGNRGGQWKEESFWIIRSLNNQSCIIKKDKNPIKTTYELLWREIKIPLDQINTVTIFNTLRRILEYYFNIIGSVNYGEIIDKFDGEEKIIFRALVSWMNVGSHSIDDDLVVSTGPETIEKQLKVFEEIFKKLNHESHYNMMMSTDNE